MKKLLIVAVAAFGLTASAQAANIVNNGDFEAPIVGNPYQTFAGSFTGWTVDYGNIDIVRTPSYPAFDGFQALDLVGTGVSTASISQVLATAIGQTYELTFAYINNTDAGGPFTADVKIDGVTLTSVSDSGGLPWNIFTGTFKATSTSTLLSFVDTSMSGNQGLFIDGVSVSAVPEATTWAMMIGGFGLVGGALRRRRAGDLVTA